MSVGIGIDYMMAKNTGLYLRHRYFRFNDKSFPKDAFEGNETTLEIKSNVLMNKLLIIISGILCYWNILGQSQKFQVNGAARTYIFANELNIDQEIDSITPRNANYGHSLLDLGFSIFPNKQTEVIGAFRIRNELGGFWGRRG